MNDTFETALFEWVWWFGTQSNQQKSRTKRREAEKNGSRERELRSAYAGKRATSKAGPLGSKETRREGSSNAGKQETSSSWTDLSRIKLNGAGLS